MIAGTLEIDFVTNLARLQGELTAIKRAVGDTMGEAVAQHNQLVRSSEALAKQLEREAQTFGMSAAQVRELDVATKALALDERGLTEQAERLRSAQVTLNTAHMSSVPALQQVSKEVGFNRSQMVIAQSALLRFSDAVMSGMSPLQAFALEAHKGVEVMGLDAGGFAGGLLRVAGLAAGLGAPLAVIGVAFERWNKQVSDHAGLQAYADQLGLTKKQIEDLGGASVTTGDMLKGIWKTIKDDLASVFNGKKLIDYLFSPTDAQQLAGFAASIYGAFVGSYRAVIETWRQFPAALGDLFIQAVNAAIASVQWLVNKGVDAVDYLGGHLQHVDLGTVTNRFKGAASSIHDSFVAQVTKATAEGSAALKHFADQSAANATQIARDRLKAGADDSKDKIDKHAEALARDAAAEEAQIAGLFALADAYQHSGAAALVAEATEKARSKAIKSQADQDAEVSRQVRMAVAQRTADAAKEAAALNEQSDVRERLNGFVEAGILTEQQASQEMRNQIQLVPILAAMKVAEHNKDAKAMAEAKAAYDALVAAQERASATADPTPLPKLDMKVTLAYLDSWINKQGEIDEYVEKGQLSLKQWDEAVQRLQDSTGGLADAWGGVGKSVGDAITILTEYGDKQNKLDKERQAAVEANRSTDEIDSRSRDLQMNSLVGLTEVTKSLFGEHTKGAKAAEAAEKVLTAVQLARTAGAAVEALAEGTTGIAAQAKLPFPANIVAMSATAAALVAAGVAVLGGGGGHAAPVTNQGKGTVLGDDDKTSDSIKNAIQLLGDVDTMTMHYSAQMAASLKSIETALGGVASLLVRTGDIKGATDGIQTGFQSDTLGKALGAYPTAIIGGLVLGPVGAALGAAFSKVIDKIPVVGDILGGISGVLSHLFGSKTSIVGSGIYGGTQSLNDVLSGGYDLQTYADVKKTKKFFGISAGSKYSTEYGSADPELGQQFTLILKSFDDAITAAGGPLGIATGTIEDRLKDFSVDLGKIDFTGLSGDDIQKKLEAVFGAAADDMASAAFPGIEKFQQVGEGAFETLTRVASTVEAVTSDLAMLGRGTADLGLDAKMGLSGMFKSVDDMNSTTQAYFENFYTDAEQTAMKTKQLGDVFAALGLQLPASIADYRALVDAQDLTTAAGQSTYATLIQLGPAFAQLSTAMQDATSAAAIVRERQDLESKLLDLQGDTVAIRAAELSKLDPSNRELQQRIYELQDEQAATEAANQLASQRADLENQLLQLNGDTATQRANELAAMDASLRPLQELIWARQDEQAASTAAAQAAEQAAQAEQALAEQRADLQGQLWQLTGDQASIRAAELAKITDPIALTLQKAIYVEQDRQAAAEAAAQASEAAAQAADQLRQAWQSIADSIMDEVKRILGLTQTLPQSYATLLAQFNASTSAARAGDQDAAKGLPEQSKALLDAAARVATSRQELARIQGMTAASLQDTLAVINARAFSANDNSAAIDFGGLAALPTPATNGSDDLVAEVRALRAEVAGLRGEQLTANDRLDRNTGRTRQLLENVTGESGGSAVSVQVDGTVKTVAA